jgi:hypothetical protein
MSVQNLKIPIIILVVIILVGAGYFYWWYSTQTWVCSAVITPARHRLTGNCKVFTYGCIPFLYRSDKSCDNPFIRKDTGTSDISETDVSEATENWKTYHNEEYGLSLKYPPDLEADIKITSEVPLVIFFETIVDSPKKGIVFGIKDDLNPKELSIRNLIEEDPDVFDNLKYTSHPKVGGVETILLDNGTITFTKASYIFSIINGVPPILEPISEAIFDQIISTFKFIDSDKISCEETSGKYAGCPAIPSPNAGLCIPCECSEGFTWSFVKSACIVTESNSNSQEASMPNVVEQLCSNNGERRFVTKEGQQHTFRKSAYAIRSCNSGNIWEITENGGLTPDPATFYFSDEGALLDICQALFWQSGCKKFESIACEQRNYCSK